MARARLPQLNSFSGSFESKKANPLELLEDKPLGGELLPMTIGKEITPIEIAENNLRFTSSTKIEGKLEVDGNVVLDNTEVRDLDVRGGQFTIYEDGSTTNYARFLFSASNATLLGASDLNIDAGNNLMIKADGNEITWYGGSGVSNVWTLSTDGMTMGGYSTSNRSYTLATTGTGDLKFEAGDGSFLIKESASAGADTAAYGQLWVKNETPNELYFTNDAGNDIQITDGSSMAGGGGGASALNDLSDVTYSSGDLTISSLDKIVLSEDLHIDSSADKIYIDVTKDGSNPCGIYYQKAADDFSYTTCQYNLSGSYWIGDEGADTAMGWISVAADGVMSIGTYDGFGNIADIKLSADGMIKNENGSTYFKERSAAWTDVTAYGQLWVKDDTPNNIYFTNDTGTDIPLNRWFYNTGSRFYTRYDNWYYPSVVYGVNSVNWSSTFSSSSLTTSWNDSYNPILVLSSDIVLTSYHFWGNFSGSEDYELALLKGTGVTYGSNGNYTVSQIGSTQSVSASSGILYKLEETGLSVSLSAGDTIIPALRRTTTDTSTYRYFEFSMSLEGVYV